MTTPSPRLDGGHTPGPWQAGHRAWPEQIGCCPLIGRPFSVHRTDNYENVAAATTKANARLIAAAPDMLEALVGIVTHWEACEQGPGHSHEVPGVWDSDNHPGLAGTRCEWCAQWSKARAAVARARGKDHA